MQPGLFFLEFTIRTFAIVIQPNRHIRFRDHKTAIRADAIRVPGVWARIKPGQLIGSNLQAFFPAAFISQ